jgi:hypothetical protein
MADKNKYGAAFPHQRQRKQGEDGSGLYVFESGMTLRDYFAAKALQGLLPARDSLGRTAYTELTPKQVADSAYEIADAMLKARNA